jgi:hypothetical protein
MGLWHGERERGHGVWFFGFWTIRGVFMDIQKKKKKNLQLFGAS